MYAKKPIRFLWLFTFITLSALLMIGCRASEEATTPDLNLVATVVEATLKAMPTSTDFPTQEIFPPTDPPVLETDVPTDTPTITLTPTETLTPSPTPIPTLDPGDPRATLGNPAWQASFKDGSSWFTFKDEEASIQIKNGTLVLRAFKANSYENWSMAPPKISDFYLEIQGASGDICQGKDRYGLIFRAPDPNMGYLFGISCDGHYHIRTWSGEEFTELRGWQPSNFILAGPNQTNRVGVLADGNHLSFFINGQKVEELSDKTYSNGAFGAYIAAAETPGLTIEVSQATYWNLHKQVVLV
jgi:hypothetical protein